MFIVLFRLPQVVQEAAKCLWFIYYNNFTIRVKIKQLQITYLTYNQSKHLLVREKSLVFFLQCKTFVKLRKLINTNCTLSNKYCY